MVFAGLRELDLAAASFSSAHVHELLSKTYPDTTLRWVKRADWKLHPALPLSSLNMARRPGGRDPAKIEAIRASIRAGKHMAPIVTVKRGDGTHDIADGFHRALAFQKERRSTIPAYVGTGLPEKGPWRKSMHAAKLNLADPVRQRIIDLAVATARGAGATGIHVGPHHWKHGWIPLTPEAWASHLKRVHGWHAPRVRRGEHFGHLRNNAHTNASRAGAHHEAFIRARGQEGIATFPKSENEQRKHLEERHGLVGHGLGEKSPTELEKLHGAEHGLRPATARERTAGRVRTSVQRAGGGTAEGLHGERRARGEAGPDTLARINAENRRPRKVSGPKSVLHPAHREKKPVERKVLHAGHPMVPQRSRTRQAAEQERKVRAAQSPAEHVKGLEREGAGLGAHLQREHPNIYGALRGPNMRRDAIEMHREAHGLAPKATATRAREASARGKEMAAKHGAEERQRHIAFVGSNPDRHHGIIMRAPADRVEGHLRGVHMIDVGSNRNAHSLLYLHAKEHGLPKADSRAKQESLIKRRMGHLREMGGESPAVAQRHVAAIAAAGNSRELRSHMAGIHGARGSAIARKDTPSLIRAHNHEHGILTPRQRTPAAINIQSAQKTPEHGGDTAKLVEHMQQKHDAGAMRGVAGNEIRLAHKADHQRNGFAAARRQGRNPVNHAHGSEAGGPTIPFRERVRRDKLNARGMRKQGGGSGVAGVADRVLERARQAPDLQAAAQAHRDVQARDAEGHGRRAKHIAEQVGKTQQHQRAFNFARGPAMARHLKIHHGINKVPRLVRDRKALHAREHGAHTPAPGGFVYGVPRHREKTAPTPGSPEMGNLDGIAGEEGRTPENIANGTDKGSAEFKQTVKDAIASGIKEREPAGAGGVDNTEFITFNNGTRLHMRQENVMGARDGAGRGPQGEKYLEREKVANDIARAMGIHSARVETTNIPGIGKVNLQEMLPSKRVGMGSGVHTEEGKRIGLLDHVIANSDRHGGNYLIQKNGQPVAIDHGLAFNPRFMKSPFFRAHSYDPADRQAAAAAVAPFEQRVRDTIGPQDTWEKLQQRIARIGK